MLISKHTINPFPGEIGEIYVYKNNKAKLIILLSNHSGVRTITLVLAQLKCDIIT